ncbi:MAG: hypothetical protein O2779_04860 [Nanoarchaeota archaeon]|nr:hypothetical protein [Nanoarchaeota archaeon]
MKRVNTQRLVAVCLVLALLAASQVLAIGVSPARKVVHFEPNLDTTITQKVFNNENKDMKVVLYARGELQENIQFVEDLLLISSSEETRDFSYRLRLPADIGKPGLHSTEIVVMELPGSFNAEDQSSVSAVASVISELYVRVPFPDKYAEAKLVIESSGVNNPVRFVMPIFNYGSQRIVKAKASIEIQGATYEQIGLVETNEVGLEKDGEGKLVATWSKQDLNPGVYHAKATLEYDGETMVLEENFRVGDLSIEIIDLKADKFRLGTISAIDMYLENKWNNDISDIYAIMTVTDTEGTDYAQEKTSTIDLSALGKGKLTAYWDTREIPAGFYDLNIELHYEGKTTTRIINANINIDSFKTEFSPVGQVVVGQASANRNTMLYLLILLLIGVNVGWFFYFVRKKKK